MRGYGMGLQVEPFVSIELEVSMHGILTESGETVFGPIVVQSCDAQGAWVSQRSAEPGELSVAELESFAASAHTVGCALKAAGYFGPFAIDGYLWRSFDGERQLQALSDLNARYTMGFFEAMAGRSEVCEFIDSSRD